MKPILLILLPLFIITNTNAQWKLVDSAFGPLPNSVHIYFTDNPIDTSPFRAYYLIADLKDKKLKFLADTSHDRRLKPSQFYERNSKPLAVVNCTFFSYETNRSLNAVIKNGELVAFNSENIAGRGKDTFTYRHALGSAFGINKKREADIAWLYTDSSWKHAFASQVPVLPIKDSSRQMPRKYYFKNKGWSLNKWKMKTAVGGGPVLLQNGEIKVTNNEEIKFANKAISDKHPRTAMGYTRDGKLIILMIEGRSKIAGGANLTQMAQIFKELGCVEAINLDGGGSSCLLINGKETIKVSDKEGQRGVPAVFIIKRKL